MIERLRRHPLAILLLTAFIVRLLFMLLLRDTLDFVATGAVHGSEAYDAYALNLLETGVYGRTAGTPDAILAPLYSYVLALVYAVLGRGFVQVGLLNTLLDLLAIWMLVAIGRRLFAERGQWVGLLAGLFYAVYPYLVFQNLTLIDTPLFMVLLNAFVLALIHLRQRPAYDRGTLLVAIVAGLIFGFSLLTRALLPMLALLAVPWFLLRLNLWQTVTRLLPVALVGFVLILPWMLRSSAIYEAFVPLALNSGENIYQGSNPMTVPLLQAGYDVQWSPPPPELADLRDSYQRNAALTEAGISYLQQNPQAIPELILTKLAVHWNIAITPLRNPQPGETFVLDEAGELLVLRGGESITGVTDANISYDEGLLNTLGRPVHSLYFGTLLLLSVLGIGLSLPLWRDVSLLWAVQICMTLMYVIFHPSTRYRVPSDPLLFLFAAYALVWIWLRLRDHWQRPEAVVTAKSA